MSIKLGELLKSVSNVPWVNNNLYHVVQFVLKLFDERAIVPDAELSFDF